MKNSEQLTPAAAAVTALATFLCCVPTTFAAAVATTSVGLFVADYQGWFLTASVLLSPLARGRCGPPGAAVRRPGRRVSAILLGVSAAIVVAIVLFPQVLAGFMADWLG